MEQSLILVLPGLPTVLLLLLQPKVHEIAALLGTPEGTLIGWIHFVAFDLFVGRWIYLDSRQNHISPGLASPLLFLTLMLGPLGLFSYLLCCLFMKPTSVGSA